jgi:hypothetical protein
MFNYLTFIFKLINNISKYTIDKYDIFNSVLKY